MNITLSVPYPPSVNHQYRRGEGGIVRLTKAVKDFRVLVAEQVMIKCIGQRRPLFANAKVSLDVRLSPPDRRVRDIDGPIKALLDALTHAGVWQDDAQVHDLHIGRGEIVRGGLCVVHIESK